MPSDAGCVLRIDAANGQVRWAPTRSPHTPSPPSTLLPTSPSSHSLPSPPPAPHLPSKVSWFGDLGLKRNKWQGGVFGKDGRVYCIPCDANQVLAIHPRTSTLSLHGDLGDGEKKFQGAYLAGWAHPKPPFALTLTHPT